MIPLLLLFIAALFNFNALVTPLSNEGIALLTFKQSISADPGGSLSNWNASDDTPCSWNGITCKDQKVVSVSIPKNKLSGFLPSALGFLPDLRHLNLRANQFYGALPLELFQAQGLQSLVLSGNFLSGSLPIDIGNLSYLQTLDFSQNLFNGSIPMSILQLKRLKTLDFSHNNLTGLIPDGFGANLGSLEKLDLSFNNLNGAIPSDVGNLTSLQGTVDFSHNLFTGSIPSSLGNLPEKVYIDLSYNNLTGSIPQNGALMNRGPTAFIGNPNLCGPPLKDPCSSSSAAASPSSYPYLPNNATPGKSSKKSKGLSTSTVIAIVVSDVIGICLVGLLCSYCYSRVCGCGSKKDDDYGLDKGRKGRNKCFCFRKDESETLSENVEQYDLVALDSKVAFDLDELLKASAFVLGKSGIGIVYKVVLEDGVTLAVRRLGEGGSQRFKEFQTEVEAIGKLKHLNIVRLRAYYWSVEEKLLIYDYIPNGSLATALHGKAGTESFTPLSWSERLRIMQGVAKGLVYLHEFSPKKYVHGDLKPNNILLDHNTEPRISDFGLGRLANITGGSPTLHSNRMASEKHSKSTTLEMSTIGSMVTSGCLYQAPEALKTMKPSQKWDIYSFGVVLLEMITGRYPVVEVGSLEMRVVDWIEVCIEEKKALSDVVDPYLAADYSDREEEEMVSVLKMAIACAHASPERRPTMRHVSEALERLGGGSSE